MEENEKSAAQQAAEAPDVATAGASEPVGTVEVGEQDRAQQEHLERRSNPQLPDPGQPVGTSDEYHKDQPDGPETTVKQGDEVSADKLASDGDRVVEGLPENGQEADA